MSNQYGLMPQPSSGFQLPSYLPQGPTDYSLNAGNPALGGEGLKVNPLQLPSFGQLPGGDTPQPGNGIMGALGGQDVKNGLGALGGIAGLYTGLAQLGLYKEQLAFQKDSFERNYAANRQTTNASLEDRQRARVASNPGAYQSVGAYMKQNGIA